MKRSTFVDWICAFDASYGGIKHAIKHTLKYNAKQLLWVEGGSVWFQGIMGCDNVHFVYTLGVRAFV